jgi:ankyrin repeat protein
VTNHEGCTALHCASDNGHLDVVRWLVQECSGSGNDDDDIVTATDHNGHTALEYASHKDHLDIVRFFVQECYVNGIAIA